MSKNRDKPKRNRKVIWRTWNFPNSLHLSHSPPHDCGYLSLWLFVEHIPIHWSQHSEAPDTCHSTYLHLGIDVPSTPPHSAGPQNIEPLKRDAYHISEKPLRTIRRKDTGDIDAPVEDTEKVSQVMLINFIKIVCR